MKCNITSASLLLGKLVDEKGDAEGMDSLGSDEKVVVLMDNDREEDEHRHCALQENRRILMAEIVGNSSE